MSPTIPSCYSLGMRFPLAFVLAAVLQSHTLAVQGFPFPQSCTELLRDAAKVYGIADSKLEERFTLDVSGFKLQGNSASPEYARVKAQAAEVAKFIAWLTAETQGSYLPLPFNRVEIVPWNIWGERNTFDLAGSTLVIRMGWQSLTCDELRAKWQRGDHLPSDLWWPLPRRSTELTLWKYANPTGLAMTSVRKGVLEGQKHFAGHIALLLQKHRSDPSKLREALVAWGYAVTGPEIGDDLESSIRNTPDEQVVEEAEALEATLNDPASVATVLSQIQFSTQRFSQEESAIIRVRMFLAFYGVGNFHWIRVHATYGNKTIATSPPAFKELDVWVIFSFIGVFTIDIIDVQAFAQKLYIASAIESAFR